MWFTYQLQILHGVSASHISLDQSVVLCPCNLGGLSPGGFQQAKEKVKQVVIKCIKTKSSLIKHITEYILKGFLVEQKTFKFDCLSWDGCKCHNYNTLFSIKHSLYNVTLYLVQF